MFINEFFASFLNLIREIYLNSKIYDKKISSKENKSLIYKPSLNILSSIVKYDKKKNKIEDFETEKIWDFKKINQKDLKKLNNFFWLFSIDLKSSKNISISIIDNWIERNQRFNRKLWDIDILSKRLISWLSNSQLIYDEGNEKYKKKFNNLVFKQINHLINEINKSKNYNNKLIGCTAVILVGLAYNHENFLNYGLNLLKKIINSSFDSEYFPKSRSIRQLVFYIKYFILIRELIRDSSNEIPDYLDEIIFHLGKGYNFVWGSHKQSLLFNGNNVSNLEEFDKYLVQQKYSFKNTKTDLGGYGVLKNRNFILAMDVGNSPENKFIENYQSGPLSFEIIYKEKKIFCNCGYHQNLNHKLNQISRSTAAHNTLVLNNTSVTNFRKNIDGSIKNKGNFHILDKNVVFEKNYWLIKGSHDGYLNEFGTIHERSLEFYPEKNKLIGQDTLNKKNNFKSTNFEIRFHLMPNSKVTKTQDNRTVLIELENSGWRFYTNFGSINVETGLYFGNKNSFVENQNIYIAGSTENVTENIKWEITKI